MSLTKTAKSSQIRERIQKLLTTAFNRKQAAHPNYSRRALARDLKVTPGFVTKIFQGEKLPPRDRLDSLCELLELDIHERAQLINAVVLGSTTKAPLLATQASDSILDGREVYQGQTNELLDRWHHLAILQGLGLKEPLNSIDEMKRRLRLTQAQIASSLEVLKQAGEIEIREGEPIRRRRHLYIPAGRSKKQVRSFHDQMIVKARHELAAKTSQHDFDRRLITGFTFTASADEIEGLKAKLLEFLNSFTQSAAESSATDVYQCNLQFFPLTEALEDEE